MSVATTSQPNSAAPMPSTKRQASTMAAGETRLNEDAAELILFGNAGRDRLVGGDGQDKLYGLAGNDRLISRDGMKDIVRGVAGDQTARLG